MVEIEKLLIDSNLLNETETARLRIIKANKDDVKKLQKQIIELLKIGFLNKNELVFLDIETEKFCIYNIAKDTIIRLNSKSILENIIYRNYDLKLSITAFTSYIPILNLVFLPNKPKIFTSLNKTYLNTFRENSVLATRHTIKDVEKLDFIDLSKYPNIEILLKNLFVKQNSLDYFLNWFSVILNTLEKNRTAIILKGVPGAGKGLLYDLLISYVFGNEHCITISNEQLKSRFNGELENKIFVVGNEIKGDFRDGNTSYEKLKMYISDREILIEDKNIKTRKILNFFNMIIFSNHDTPLQISPNDRRYSVFTTNNIKIDNLVNCMDKFIENIKKERDNFLKDLIKLKYSKYKASQPLENDDKRLIVEASTPKIELLANWLKNGDEMKIIESIDDFFEVATNKEISEIFEIDLQLINSQKSHKIETLKSEIRESFEIGLMPNNTLFFLYKIFVNHNDNTKKMATSLNSVLGDVVIYKKDKKTQRGRKIGFSNIPI